MNVPGSVSVQIEHTKQMIGRPPWCCEYMYKRRHDKEKKYLCEMLKVLWISDQLDIKVWGASNKKRLRHKLVSINVISMPISEMGERSRHYSAYDLIVMRNSRLYLDLFTLCFIFQNWYNVTISSTIMFFFPAWKISKSEFFHVSERTRALLD